MSKFDDLYMGIAIQHAKKSHDERFKVGCFIVKDDKPISAGWNGTPPGDDNNCRDENGITKPSVIHAEMNAILKAARTTGDLEGATMYCTLSPCVQCANAIRVCKFSRLVYLDEYPNTEGLNMLIKNGMKVEKYVQA